MSGGRRWSEEELSYLAAHHANEPDAAIAAALGRTVKAVRKRARKMGLLKDATYKLEQIRKSANLAHAAVAARRDELVAKVTASNREKARRERIRYLYGLDPLTRWFKPSGQSRVKMNFRSRLRKKGMWEFTDAANCIYYQDGSEIHPRIFKTAAKYGLKLLPLSEYHGNRNTRVGRPFVEPTNNEFDYDI